jgi:hypothetical protein
MRQFRTIFLFAQRLHLNRRYNLTGFSKRNGAENHERAAFEAVLFAAPINLRGCLPTGTTLRAFPGPLSAGLVGAHRPSIHRRCIEQRGSQPW